jgi:RNA polymerase sigma-70 factor (ECF subfamily)
MASSRLLPCAPASDPACTSDCGPQPPSLTRLALATRNELSDFLESVERRAFKHAAWAVRDEQAALDIVQDSMMRLAERYGDRPPAELPLVFQRILQNAIRDHFRRMKVRNEVVSPLSDLGSRLDEDESDPLERLEIEDFPLQLEAPDRQLSRAEALRLIEIALEDLPARQREAFLLRYWEEFDVAETAGIMGCSEGSVKTHCSRATHALAAALKARGYDR